MTMPKDREHAPGFVPGQGYTQEDWDEVCDNPEWTEEDFAKARPFKEAMPELYAAWKRKRGAQKAPTKRLISLRLDQDVIERFRATGPGWQGRMNEALRAAMPAESAEPTGP